MRNSCKSEIIIYVLNCAFKRKLNIYILIIFVHIIIILFSTSICPFPKNIWNVCVYRFIEAVAETTNLSDKLGYIYWFAVLVTISCGGATGVFMTMKNKHEMTIICQQKYEFYEKYWLNVDAATMTTTITANNANLSFAWSTKTNATNENNNATSNRNNVSSSVGINAKHKNNDGFVGINELVARVNHFDKMFE